MKFVLLVLLILLPLQLVFAQEEEHADDQLVELMEQQGAESAALIQKAQDGLEQRDNSASVIPKKSQEEGARELIKELARQSGALKEGSKSSEQSSSNNPLDLFKDIDVYKLSKHSLAGFRKVSEQETLDFLKEKIRNPKVLEFLNEHPLILRYAVILLRDEESLPRLVSVINEQEKLLQYAIFIIVTLITSWLWNKFRSPKVRVFWAILRWFRRLLFWISFRLTFFYFLFQKELDPILHLTWKFLKLNLLRIR